MEEKSCNNCKYEDYLSYHTPCVKCLREGIKGFDTYWEPKEEEQ